MKQLKIEISYQSVALSELTDDQQLLVKKARAAMQFSYSPYSNFTVGCAIELKDGTITIGANQENASFGATICAERSTLFSLYNQGKKGDVRTIVVTGKMRNAPNNRKPLAPCGICRQVLKEEEDLGKEPITIIMDCLNNDEIFVFKGVDSLLPLGFGPADL